MCQVIIVYPAINHYCLLRISAVDCVNKDDAAVADKYGMCLPTMDGGHLKDVKSQIVPSASNVKAAPSAKRSKYCLIFAAFVNNDF